MLHDWTITWWIGGALFALLIIGLCVVAYRKWGHRIPSLTTVRITVQGWMPKLEPSLVLLISGLILLELALWRADAPVIFVWPWGVVLNLFVAIALIYETNKRVEDNKLRIVGWVVLISSAIFLFSIGSVGDTAWWPFHSNTAAWKPYHFAANEPSEPTNPDPMHYQLQISAGQRCIKVRTLTDEVSRLCPGDSAPEAVKTAWSAVGSFDGYVAIRRVR